MCIRDRVTTISAPDMWASDDVTVSVEVTGPVSVQVIGYHLGAAAETTYTAPFVVTDEGTTTVSACATDTNGMNRGDVTATVRIDRTAPVTTDDHAASYSGPATIHLSAVDTMSGPDYTRYRLDSSAVSTGSVVTTSAPGAHTLQYASTDGVGNTETTRSITFTIAAAKTTYSTRMALTGASKARRGRSYTLTVWMAPRSATGSVRLAVQRKVGRTWRTVRNARMWLSAGKGTYRFKPGYRGSWRFRAYYDGATTSTSIFRSCSMSKSITVR
jgi:hypothetical protein